MHDEDNETSLVLTAHTGGEHITMSISGHAANNLPLVLDVITRFLRGAGFVFDGELNVTGGKRHE